MIPLQAKYIGKSTQEYENIVIQPNDSMQVIDIDSNDQDNLISVLFLIGKKLLEIQFKSFEELNKYFEFKLPEDKQEE